MDETLHYYDTRLRGIPCGAKGPDVRSTKHARSVTCRSCIHALREKPPVEQALTESSGVAGP